MHFLKTYLFRSFHVKDLAIRPKDTIVNNTQSPYHGEALSSTGK